VHVQIDKFIVGSLLGLVVPISLAWAQYVHPINVKTEHSFLQEEPETHSDSSIIWSRQTLKNAKKTHPPAVNTYEYLTPASTCLNTPDHFFGLSNKSQFNFDLYDEFQNAFENAQVPHIHRKIESNFPSLDFKKISKNFLSNPLPGSSYDFQNPLVPLENRDLQESKYYFSLIEPIAKPQNQKLSRIEKKGRKELKPFLTKYPNFSSLEPSSNFHNFDIFSLNFPETEFDEEAESFVRFVQNSRQRRADWNYSRVYSWEINDFDPSNTSANPIGAISSNPTPDQNLTAFNPLYPSIEPKLYEENPPDSGNFEQISVKLSIEANDGVGSLAVLAYGMTGGNALNDYTGTSGFHFMTATDWDDVNGDVTEHFTFETSGIDAWLNGFDPYNNPTDLWGVYKNGDDFYLTYEFSNLNFTPVPEPSTYFMTGALFCLIGCNRTSRNTLKIFLSKVFMHWKTKAHIEDVQDRIS
jgi:hypothetical protein